MNGFDPALSPHDSEASATATQERPATGAQDYVDGPMATDDGAASPDPLFHTDRYRLVMPYTDRI